MARNMRDMFLRKGLSEQEVRTFRGLASALIVGRRGKSAP